MRFFKDFQGPIEKDSHLYLRCRKCSGVFFYNSHPRNPVISTVGCPHCGHRDFGCLFEKGIGGTEKYKDIDHRKKIGFGKANIDQNDIESGALILRVASVVAKEGVLQHMLRVIQKHKNGIHTKELEQIMTSCGYRLKLIDQANYFGLISKEFDTNGISFCYLTEKGLKVLKACNKL